MAIPFNDEQRALLLRFNTLPASIRRLCEERGHSATTIQALFELVDSRRLTPLAKIGLVRECLFDFEQRVPQQGTLDDADESFLIVAVALVRDIVAPIAKTVAVDALRMLRWAEEPTANDLAEVYGDVCTVENALKASALVQVNASEAPDQEPNPPIISEGTPVAPAAAEFVKLMCVADEAIGQYASLRAAIFRELVAMKVLGGGPWKIQYKRDPAERDPTIPTKWTYHTTTGPIIINGHALNGIGNVKQPETYAPIKSFELLDASERNPEPKSEAAATESRLLFLLNGALGEAKKLAVALPAIQREARLRKLGINTEALARLDLQLPVFPYWPRSPKEMTQADFDRVLADEKPLLDDARLTLHRLSIEASTFTEPETDVAFAGATAGTHQQPSHSTDFTFVKWHGTEYTFALGVQSAAVKALWEEWEKTGLGLHQGTIRNAVDPERDSFRMDKAFRNHPALGTMIQKTGDGRYKLAPPTKREPESSAKAKKSARIPSKARRKPR